MEQMAAMFQRNVAGNTLLQEYDTLQHDAVVRSPNTTTVVCRLASLRLSEPLLNLTSSLECAHLLRYFQETIGEPANRTCASGIARGRRLFDLC